MFSGVIAGFQGCDWPLFADCMIPSAGSWLVDASISIAMQAAYSHITSQKSFAIVSVFASASFRIAVDLTSGRMPR
jgi:hypothetical protein